MVLWIKGNGKRLLPIFVNAGGGRKFYGDVEKGLDVWYN
jgi:hypothetical protein